MQTSMSITRLILIILSGKSLYSQHSTGCGRRDNATFTRLYERLSAWNVKIYFADGWNAYSDVIPPELLIQTKAETHLIESNNAPQRHWFARFRRKTVCVSRSERMVDLTVGLYANFHVNYEIDYDYFLEGIVI